MTTYASKPHIALYLVALVLLLNSACSASPSQPVVETTTNPQQSEVIISQDALLVETPLDELVKQADLIVVGEVVDTLAPRANTPDGTLPNNSSIEELPESTLIFTDVSIQVESIIKGTLSSNTVVVRLLGGTIGNVTMDADYDPNLSEGQRVLLFLTTEDMLTGSDGSTHYKVIAAPNAAYEIIGENAVDGAQSIPLDELIEDINQFLK